MTVCLRRTIFDLFGIVRRYHAELAILFELIETVHRFDFCLFVSFRFRSFNRVEPYDLGEMGCCGLPVGASPPSDPVSLWSGQQPGDDFQRNIV